ncbi:hypothetical protein JDV09_10625 [Mycobacterium sp. Y57]|uniref:hypothetical protein n=1 Tax=Mycolicibacterium xanthum TaxID=2796469 RepID=UPI001C855842|nr:hypothetical protein [Mycolicibacterium xanthum]MBX7432553.1 hypothetical protein [Mycolicibacterium xanthum]
MVYYSPRDPLDDPQSGDEQPRTSPTSFGPSYWPNLITALVASVAVFVGSLGPWASFLALNASGFEINLNSGWGGTLTISGISAFVLFVQLNLGREGRTPWLIVLLTGLIPVVAATSFVIALIFIIRVRSGPALDMFGTQLAAQVGWGLWVVAAGSAVLWLTSWVVTSEVCTSIKVAGGQVASSLADVYFALVSVALLALGLYTYYSWDEFTSSESKHVLNLAPLAPSQASAPTPSQPPTSRTPTTTPPGATHEPLLKEIGEQAVLVGPDGPVLDFVVADITIDSCTSTSAAPMNGTFIVIDIAAHTHADPIVASWSGMFDAENWRVVGPDGYTEPHVDTLNGSLCSRHDPPDTFAVNSKYWFQIVLDTRYRLGELVFQPFPEDGSWEWTIPQ